MSKKLLHLVALACWAPFCYSDSIAPYYGYTGNAAALGNSWSMDNVLPSPPGLDINAVIYNYTIQKQTEDSVTVNVQNENAVNGGYIFRETDQWNPGSLSGTQINKVIGVPDVPREFWGNGSIEVDGPGAVLEPRVVYSYRVTPCFDPQFDPNCPGYQVPVPDINSPDYSDYLASLNSINGAEYNTDTEQYEDDEEQLSEEDLAKREAEEKKKRDGRLEKALAARDNSALFADAFNQSRLLSQMNSAVNMTQYYSAYLAGGTYNDVVNLDGGNISDNKQALRNMAQDKLHKDMVDMQY